MIDAEMTTPIDWCERLMSQYADHPCYLASRPRTYEDANTQVRSFCETIGTARAKSRIPEDTTGLVVVDSLRKLVPHNFFEKLLRGADEVGVDGMNGRGAMMKAALNAQWLDEVVSLLHETNCAMVLVVRETEDPAASQNEKKYGTDFKIGGGKAVLYDSSLAIRITSDKWVYKGPDKDAVNVGERHRARIWKTKVACKDDRHSDCYFHTSNGVLVPEGFDVVRDLIDLAVDFGMIHREGAWFRWGERSYNGIHQAVEKISAEIALVDELSTQVRSGFGNVVEEEVEGEEAQST
jgi:RecA/RadA recombinase